MIADPIADLRSPSGSLISMYARRPTPGGFGALLTDLMRPLRDRAFGLGRRAVLAVKADTDRIHELADRFEMEAAPAYAVFASSSDDVFVIEPLTHDVPNVAMLGPRPYMRPLRSAPKDLRSGVIVADHSVARVFTASNGVVVEAGEPIAAEIGKPNFAGFAGYDEHSVRSHAAEATRRIWKSAGALLLEAHQSRALDYIAFGATDESIDGIARHLHPYLARLPRVTFPAGPLGFTIPSLRAELSVHDTDIRRQRQGALAGRVCDVAWSGGNAVLGLGATLDAANLAAIDSLVVAGEFARTGALCPVCSRIARTGGPCPVCEAVMFEIDDVVAAVMEATIMAGGLVNQIEVASPLDMDGIGALTRFPVAV